MPDESTSDGRADAAAGTGPARSPGRRRRRPRTRRQRVLQVLVWTAVAVVVLGGSLLGFAYFKFNGNISGIDINAALGTDRPVDTPDGSLDILVLGSDSRSGSNAEYGTDEAGARSDTAMVVHVNKEHDRASIVSIPRDTIIDRPACVKDDGSGVELPAQQAMFNSAYKVGGPACAVKTVESLSKVRMDHYVEVDFTGFKKIIDTLGGVEITTSAPIQDQDSHVDLAAGTHRLDGEQALGLVRTRHGVGDGSDLGRIQVQQAFMKALIEQVKSVGFFSDPKKLYDLADTATSAVTTDSELDSAGDLAGLGKLLQGIAADDIRMTTLPVAYDPADPNRVVPLEAKTQQVWTAIRKDVAIPESATEDSAGEQTDINGVVR